MTVDESNVLCPECARIADALRRGGHAVSIGGFIDSDAVEAWTGIPERTLRNWRSAGLGPVWFSLNGVRYRLHDLHEWLEVQRQAGSPCTPMADSGNERQPAATSGHSSPCEESRRRPRIAHAKGAS